MARLASAFVVIMAAMALAAPVEAQVTPDRLMTGHWECTLASTSQQYERVTADFEGDSSMEIRFYAVINGGAIRMTLTLSGAWTYDPATGVIGHTVSAARIDDMVVNGTPVARSDHPEGEAGIARREQELVAQHGESPFTITTLEEDVLVLLDEGGDTLNCAR